MTTGPDLPYFDLLLGGRARGEAASAVFSRYVHWGYWDDPGKGRRRADELPAAMERLNSEVLAGAALSDGLSVLDAGCGFGGTIGWLDKRHRGLRLTGLNIDGRQLAVAREEVKASEGNTISWVEGDACALPFADASFDRVLAVECIFHFPSRLRFLKEAARVLKPGGRIALSDFVPPRPGGKSGFLSRLLEREISKGYGFSCGWPDGGYASMAAEADLKVEVDRDVTRQTLPTYPILLDMAARGASARALLWPTRWLYWASRWGAVDYRILSFRR